MTAVEVVTAPALSGIPHGFLGRRGGISTGDLAGLNVGYGSNDQREAIAENRRRAVAAILPSAQLVTVHQVHSGDCIIAERALPQDERPLADAMVTSRTGLMLGILTADCAPVLFADEKARVVGAAHAGWRGAFAGVTDATIAAMEQLGARREDIRAVVGPCIARASYEVDDGFRERFLAQDAANDRFFSTTGAKPHFDLEAYVVHRLTAAGVGAVDALHLDTYADEARFYSFRRATHRRESDYGRQLSAIAVPAA